MKRILLFIPILALFVLPVLAQKTKSLTNADKAQIIRAILLDNRFDARYYLPDEERLVVYLSTENINQNSVPDKVGEAKILLRNSQELEKEKKSGRSYGAFGKFETDGSTAIVSFYYYRKNPEAKEYFREIKEYEYRKVAGKWKFVSRKHPGLKVGSKPLMPPLPTSEPDNTTVYST